jgi:predicted SAM-dependent methyltransferase
VFLEHDHNGFGLAKSANQGLDAAKTEYVLLIEGDEVLSPGSLAETLEMAQPEYLLCALKSYIKEGWEPGTSPNFLVTKDHRTRYLHAPHRFPRNRWWAFCSGGHLLIHRNTHLRIGGFDESYGYGFHDYDYAARWMRKVGDDHILYGGGRVWHLGEGASKRKGVEHPDPEVHKKLARTLVRSIPKLHLGCGAQFNPEFINIDAYPCYGADVIFDAKNLDWVDDNSLEMVYHCHFLEHLEPWDAAEHLRQTVEKLKPKGQLRFYCPDIRKCAELLLDSEQGSDEEYFALQGMFGEVKGRENAKGGMNHLWGWDAETLRVFLESLGMEVRHAGENRKATFAKNRDLEVEAYKK